MAEVIEWRGPAPFYFLPISGELADHIRDSARLVSYGWGVVPVRASIGDISWQTSLIPRQGNYLLPLKDDIRKSIDIKVGQSLTVELQISS